MENLHEVTAMKQILTTIITIALGNLSLSAQFLQIGKKGSFYGGLHTQALFCQIDGDGASGYNKIGIQVQTLVGMALNENEGVEWSLGFSERGSRKGINPETNDFRIFHIRHQWLETGLAYARLYKGFIGTAGLRFGYLVAAEEAEGTDPNIEKGMRPIHGWAELGVKYPIANKWSLSLSGSYSLWSFLKNDPSTILPNSIYRSAGQFTNNIGIGIIFTP